MPQTPRQNCCDCEALAEVLARPRPRRRVPARPTAARQAAPALPEADGLIIAALSPVLTRIHQLLYVRKLGVRAAARELGVSPASVVAARKRLLRQLAGGANTGTAPPEVRTPPVMKRPKLPVKAGHVQILMDPACEDGLYVSHTHSCNLTGPQAVMLSRLYQALNDGGVKLREQGEVFGWLLDRFRDQLALDADVAADVTPPAAACAVCGTAVADGEAVRKFGGRGVLVVAHTSHFAPDAPAGEREEAYRKVDAARAAAESRLTVGAV